MHNFNEHIIPYNLAIKEALSIIDKQGLIANVLFVIDVNSKIIGTVTDGDIRRGFINGLTIRDTVSTVVEKNFKFFPKGNIKSDQISILKKSGIFLVPVIDDEKNIVDILDLREYRALLPVDTIIMAGGKGTRLMPLTKNIPKPMLKVGDKPILEHNITRLKKFGIDSLNISVNYLADVITDYFKDGAHLDMKINYVHENQPLGTLGALTLVKEFQHDYILIMNSDLLTDIDFSDFFEVFLNSGADMAVATVSYQVDVPYGVLEVDESNRVYSLKEKPRYSYYSNAGIYLINKKLLSLIPQAEVFNVTDLMDLVIKQEKKLIAFPIIGYWLDIGKPEDFQKAQRDILHVKI